MERKPKIVSAATKHSLDGREIIVASPRHYDSIHRGIVGTIIDNIFSEDPEKSFKEISQGFVDQYGTYYDREHALRIATEAGQLVGRTKTQPEHQLFSEDLY